MFDNEGFHWRDLMFWKRLDDGSVRIRLFARRSSGKVMPGDDEEPVREWIVPPSEWASIVAAVSYQGETSDTYRTALNFHGATFEGLERAADAPSAPQEE